MSDIRDKIYTRINAGLGSYYYVRRRDIHLELEIFFMHSDDWGQYGPESDRTFELAHFTYGYVEII